MAIEHATLTSDVSNASLKLLHLPGYNVATVSAMNAISTGSAGDICYVQASGAYYTYNGTVWLADLTAFSAKTGAYVLTPTDSIVTVSGTYTVTLPTASSRAGMRLTVKNVGTGIVTINTTSSQTIEGQLTQTLNAGDSVDMVSDGSNYLVI